MECVITVSKEETANISHKLIRDVQGVAEEMRVGLAIISTINDNDFHYYI